VEDIICLQHVVVGNKGVRTQSLFGFCKCIGAPRFGLKRICKMYPGTGAKTPMYDSDVFVWPWAQVSTPEQREMEKECLLKENASL
jgi:hypothetical protein